MSTPILYIGLDVHKDSGTVAVFGSTGSEPLHLEKLPYGLPRRLTEATGSCSGDVKEDGQLRRELPLVQC